MSAWRPLHHRLGDEAVQLMASQRAAGHRRLVDVHLALTSDDTPQPFRTACDPDGCPGEWITGAVEQVTCKPCLEQAYA